MDNELSPNDGSFNDNEAAHDAVGVDMPAWHLEELDRRKANLEKNPSSALSWDDVRQQLRERYAR